MMYGQYIYSLGRKKIKFKGSAAIAEHSILHKNGLVDIELYELKNNSTLKNFELLKVPVSSKYLDT